MAESTRTRRSDTEHGSIIPNLIERMFGVAEVFTNRLMDILSSSTEALINRAVQRLLILLLLGVGIVFILSGSADMLDQLLRIPGMGQIVVGMILLFVTSSVLLVTRNK